MKLLDENMAAAAFGAVNEVSPTKLGEVRSVALRMPALLASNGLAATLTTVLTKTDHGWPEYRELLESNASVKAVLHDPVSLRNLSAADYLRLTRTTSLWVGWLKRAAVATSLRTENGTGRDSSDA